MPAAFPLEHLSSLNLYEQRALTGSQEGGSVIYTEEHSFAFPIRITHCDCSQLTIF